MERFTDQPLPATPHIAVLGSDKVGNFVVTTPLLRGLKEKYPAAVVDFYGSEITRTFEESCPYLDARFSLFRKSEEVLPRLAEFLIVRRAAAGDYDLAINCNGYSEVCVSAMDLLRPHYAVGRTRHDGYAVEDPRARLHHDPKWNRPCLQADYPGLLVSGFIGEILCRLAYIETDYHRMEIPVCPAGFSPVPDVLVHTVASRRAKEWPNAYWREVIGWCRREGWRVGLVGLRPEDASSDREKTLIAAGAEDLRGALSLPELAGAFQRARVVIAVDSGPLHIAAAVGCPTLGIYGNDADGDGASPFHLWSPRSERFYPLFSPVKCRLCVELAFLNSECVVAGHPCLRSITPERVIDALRERLTHTV